MIFSAYTRKVAVAAQKILILLVLLLGAIGWESAEIDE